jgi:hypothetical protein
VLGQVVLDILHVDTVGVVDRRVVFNNGGDFTAVLFEELGGPVSDSSEALNDKGAVLDADGEADLRSEVLVASQLTDSVVNTEASGLTTAGDAALSNELARATALSVDISLALQVNVSILDPGHDLLVGAHVGAEAVDSGTDETLLDKLHGVLAGHALQLALGQITRVDFNATLSATERNIGDSELESHKGSESLNLLKIDVVRVPSATLAGQLVG